MRCCPSWTSPSKEPCARSWPPGDPILDQYTVGRTAADPDNDHAWSISFYRLESPNGKVLGVATSSVDVTDRHHAVEEQRRTALTLQRSLLPHPPPQRPGLDVAFRYLPAQATIEIGGDWFDVIPLRGDKTALVVGDVMGSGVTAAATMGQLRTATRTLADLDLAPAQVLQPPRPHHRRTGRHHRHLRLRRLRPPHRAMPHLPGRPPAAGPPSPGRHARAARPAHRSAAWAAAASPSTPLHRLGPGDQLVLYTDGLVETRDQPIDERLDALLDILDDPDRSLDATCDLLLHTLRARGDHDDVALLIARAGHSPAGERAAGHEELRDRSALRRAGTDRTNECCTHPPADGPWPPAGHCGCGGKRWDATGKYGHMADIVGTETCAVSRSRDRAPLPGRRAVAPFCQRMTGPRCAYF